MTVTEPSQKQLDDNERITVAVSDGVELGFKRLLEDEDLMKKFWAAGYKELTDHAGSGASQWIGRRILTALASALLVVALAYLLKTGALK